jgi:hypothetical protein
MYVTGAVLVEAQPNREAVVSRVARVSRFFMVLLRCARKSLLMLPYYHGIKKCNRENRKTGKKNPSQGGERKERLGFLLTL